MSYIIFVTSISFFQFPTYKQLLSHLCVVSLRTDFEAGGLSLGVQCSLAENCIISFSLHFCSVSPFVLIVHTFFLFLPVFLLFSLSICTAQILQWT